MRTYTPLRPHAFPPPPRAALPPYLGALPPAGRGGRGAQNVGGLGQPFRPWSSPTTATGARSVWILFPAGLTAPHRPPVCDQCRANACMQDEALITGGRTVAAAKPEPADFDRPASAALIRRITSSLLRVTLFVVVV